MSHRIVLILLVALLAPALALAELNPQAQPDQLAAYASPSETAKRIEDLEKQQAEIYHTLAEKKAAGLAEKITEKITLSGLIELEGALAKAKLLDGGTGDASDLVLATAQLGFDAEVTEHITADLTLLFEEDATDLEVDEAAINLTNEALYGRFGRQYLPFGVFHSHFISDPLTLALGETRQTALLGGYRNDLFNLAAFVFNGAAEKIGEEDHIRDWGTSLTLTPLEGLELGASYLSDLAESSAELLSEIDHRYTKRVGAWSALAHLELANLVLSGEVLGATGRFAPEELAGSNDQGARPLAWNLELAIFPRENLELAARVEGSEEFVGQPELQYGLDTSWGFHENVTLSLEYLLGQFDREFGDGLDKRHLVTAQLAFEF